MCEGEDDGVSGVCEDVWLEAVKYSETTLTNKVVDGEVPDGRSKSHGVTEAPLKRQCGDGR